MTEHQNASYIQTLFLFHCPNGDGKRIIDVATGETVEMSVNVTCRQRIDISTVKRHKWISGNADPIHRGLEAEVVTLKRFHNGEFIKLGEVITVTSPQLGKFYRDVRRSLDEMGSTLRDLFVNFGGALAGALSSDENLNALTAALDDVLHGGAVWDQKGLGDTESQRLNAEIQESHAETSGEWSPELQDLLLDSLGTIPAVGGLKKKRGGDNG